MSAMNAKTTRMTIGAVVATALVVVALVVANRFGSYYEISAEFPKTPGLYAGNNVVMLDVPVGKVESIKPHGTTVTVTMRIDSDLKLPANVDAVLMPKSLVTDRVVELTPYYKSGPVLADGGTIPLQRTHIPVEFQDIIKAVDGLASQLGKVEHHSGAIDQFMNVAARNARGNGSRLRDTLRGVQSALAGVTANRGDTAKLIRQLARLVGVMASSDTTVRRFSTTVTSASQILAGNGKGMNAALHQLLAALKGVAGFVTANRSALRSGINGFAGAAAQFGRNSREVAEIVDELPLMMQNVRRIVDPQRGPRVRLQVVESVLNGGFLKGYCDAALHLPLCSGLGLGRVGPDLGMTELLTGSQP